LREPSGLSGALAGLPTTRAAFARTVRLVSSARLREAVLRCLADSEAELAALAEIEAATSSRLVAEGRGFAGLTSQELIFGVPHARFINAAFAYARPRELNRFNGPARGAWYAALATATCVREVVFHMNQFLGDAGDFHASVHYAEMFASLAGEYVDMRGQHHACLDPDPAIGYPAGNRVAEAARAAGLNGIVYPSLRDPGGTCFAVLWPHAVQSVAQGDVIALTWRGTPEPVVERLAGALA
jgi:hypothetical protein